MKKKDMLLLIEQQSKAIDDLNRRLLNIEIDRAVYQNFFDPFSWEVPPAKPYDLPLK